MDMELPDTKTNPAGISGRPIGSNSWREAGIHKTRLLTTIVGCAGLKLQGGVAD